MEDNFKKDSSYNTNNPDDLKLTTENNSQKFGQENGKNYQKCGNERKSQGTCISPILYAIKKSRRAKNCNVRLFFG